MQALKLTTRLLGFGEEKAFLTLDKASTEYRDLRLLESIPMSPVDTDKRLGELSCVRLADLDVSNLSCFLYVPQTLPRVRPRTVAFDFARHAKGAITVGVCMGGTKMPEKCDDKFFELLLRGLVTETADYRRASAPCQQILEVLEGYKATYPELSKHEISFHVDIVGYSLGGLFAQATTVSLMKEWSGKNKNTATCRTYDCPGVQDQYHQMALKCLSGGSEAWNDIITNYKSMPGPLNTLFKDIGRVIHLFNSEKIAWNMKWLSSCVTATTLRITFVAHIADTLKTIHSGMTKGDDFNESDAIADKVALGLAVVLEVGSDAAGVKHDHELSTMLACFDECGAFLPGVRIEMKQWPVYEQFKDAAAKMEKSFGTGLVPFSKDNAGLHTMLFHGGKRGFIERKLANLPGYQPGVCR